MKRNDGTNDESASAVADALAAVLQAEAALRQARQLLEWLSGAGPAVPYMDAKTAERVAKLGEVAHRHLEFLETHGQSMTRADSLAIRREMYGEKVRNTANLFGERGSGALFYRDLPYGTVVKDGDPIKLTDEGLRIARLWRQLHAK